MPRAHSRRSFLRLLRCAECDREHDPHTAQTVCASCGETLLPEYDLNAVARTLDRDSLSQRPAGLWRYRELLPIEPDTQEVSLGEGGTPMIRLARLGRRLGLNRLWLKDEGCNPTATFKARGAAVGVTRARALGLRELVIPTAGNAGSAWAAYAAAAGLTLHVVMPSDTPAANKAECAAYGADIREVDGLIDEAGRVARELGREHGWFDVSTMREPYRVEGKKTMGLEIAEDFEWDPPDVILYPTGGGVGLIGVWKAMLELQAIGWVGARLPRLVAVQAAGAAPIVEALERGASEARPAENAQTVASGLRVPLPFAHRLLLRILRATGGTAIAVTDAELVDGMHELAAAEGVFAAPEGAAMIPALTAALDRGDIARDERVVLLNTGNGLKYTHLVPRGAQRSVAANGA